MFIKLKADEIEELMKMEIHAGKKITEGMLMFCRYVADISLLMMSIKHVKKIRCLNLEARHVMSMLDYQDQLL